MDMLNYASQLKSTEILGAQIWWSLKSKRTDTELIKKQLSNVGLDENLIKQESDKASFLEAIKSICKDFKMNFKKIVDNNVQIILQIYQVESNSETINLTFTEHTQFIFNKLEQKIEFNNVRTDIATLVQNKYDNYKTSTPYTLIRKTMTDLLLNNGAILQRPSGGIYFIAYDKIKLIEQLTQFIDNLTMGRIYALRIPNDTIEKETTIQVVKDDLNSRYSALRTDVTKINSRVSSLYSAQEKNKEIKKLVDKHIILLEGQVELAELQDKYNDLDEFISNKLLSLENTKQQSLF